MTRVLVRKSLRAIWFLMAPLVFTSVVHAVTYPFPEREPASVSAGTVMTAGAKLYLFYSGTEEIRRIINVNDVLTVYREYPPDYSRAVREVGKVRVLAPLGDYYFNGEVIGGEVQAGDLAKKGTNACFVTPFAAMQH